METFDENQRALGKAILRYMQIVMEMAMYIRAAGQQPSCHRSVHQVLLCP